ncbi:integrase core domain-containing protein [Glutamicibacter uratoxydans]|uniref:integrase core domain-containing protein n=1 Tax=Glutamicibacter uratoxydans TaxID=43667 RepID=UPI00389947AD
MERFHQAEHLWVNARPPAESIEELQAILDEFRHVYNTQRPHRALNRDTPEQWYHRTLKARPDLIEVTRNREFRIRYDRIDKDGKVTLRHEGKLRHLGGTQGPSQKESDDAHRHHRSHRAGSGYLRSPQQARN